MKTQTFGIEIEMNRITRERAAAVVAETLGEGATYRHTGGTYDAWEVTGPDGRKWKLVSDASIAGPRTHGTEFVSPICRWEDIETVQACVRALRAAGAHADPSCGIHVPRQPHRLPGSAGRRFQIDGPALAPETAEDENL